MDKAPKPMVLEIGNGEDYVIIWFNVKQNKVVTTSVMGNYELEQVIGQKYAEAIAAIMEHNTGETFSFETGVIVDH